MFGGWMHGATLNGQGVHSAIFKGFLV